MKISQLSEAAGVPVPTIKYYIRTGLLPRGHPTARNQARYDQKHLARLRLIRALREVAGLSVDTIGDVAAVLDKASEAGDPQDVVTALRTLDGDVDGHSPEAAAVADRLLSRVGWEIDPNSPGYRALIAALAAIDLHWPGAYSMEGLERYAAIAADLAGHEIPDDWNPVGEGDEAVTYAVLGTILFEPVLVALRRLAHADRHRRLTGADRTPSPPVS